MDNIINKQKENFLTSEEKEKLEKLPDELKEFAEAMQERPYSNLSEYSKKEFCLQIIKNFYSFSGISSDDKTLVFQINFLMEELKTKQFSSITCSEIKRAFEMGKRNEFGNYFGPSQKTYNQFLSSYMKLSLRIEAKNKFAMLLNEKNIQITTKPLEIKFKEDKNSVINAFNHFVESGALPFACSSHYLFLWKEAKVVNWSKEEKDQIENEAKKKYIDKLNSQKQKREISQDTFEKCTFQIDSTNPSFIRVCRELALEKYFTKLKNENKHLKDLIHDA